MKADLHCHSHFSDGKHPVDFLVERALENEVTHLAVTDHDCVNGLKDLSPVSGLTLINGVEISCSWDNIEIHVVGLCVDPSNSRLEALLTSQQSKRLARITKMDGKLVHLGHLGLMDYVQALPAVAYTRSHVADFLVEQQICKTRPKAFKSHLGEQGKCYVPADWCPLDEAVDTIRASGGITVLAHPGRYPINGSKIRSLIAAFKAAEGDALECTYPNIATKMNRQLVKLGIDHSLYLSGGSDFHDAGAHWTDVGKFQPLMPSDEQYAVWQHPVWQQALGGQSPS